MSDAATQDLSPELAEALARFEALPSWDAPRLISVDDLEFCSWNVNKMENAEFSELVAEIEEGGFDEPIAVIPILEEPGRYLVPSGEHRARAAVALEMERIPAVIKIHLSQKELHEVQQWTVKRNQIRGRIQVQRYIDLERSWADKHKVRAVTARQRLLIRGELLKKIRKNKGALDNEGVGAEPGDQIITADDVGDPSGPAAPSDRGGKDGDRRKPPSDGPGDGTQEDKDARAKVRDRKRMEKTLKAAWEQSLSDCPDTIENGYIVLADGKKTHLVVDTGKNLATLVSRMNAACRQEDGKVGEFLATAIANELKNWEDK
jgi:hypothetical protein